MIPKTSDAGQGLGSVNPGLFYRNGVKPNLVSPIFLESARPAGALFGHYGPNMTNVEERWPNVDEVQYRSGFPDDTTGYPWAAQEPEFLVGGGPYGAEGAALMNHPAATRISGDYRSSMEKALTQTSSIVPAYIQTSWVHNPIATFFFGCAAIWIAYEILFGGGRPDQPIQRAATSAGRTAAAPGQAAQRTAQRTGSDAAGGVVKGVEDITKGAVETVEDAVDAVTPGSDG